MADLTPDEIELIVRAAIDVRDRAYAPHSGFYVGAALMADSGEIIVGCNVENASFSLCICAERAAAVTAVSQGHRSWRALAIASDGGVTPCGACRQFLWDLGPELTLILVDVKDGSRRLTQLSKLLPEAFDRSSLPEA